MTIKEWMDIGYDSGAVVRDMDCYDEMSFLEAYIAWFKMKLHNVKPQTLDRLECTYNRYFNDTEYELICISTMDEKRIADVITSIMLSRGGLDEREYKRLYQIVNNILVYCHDMNLGGVPLIDWNMVKRYIPRRCVHQVYYMEKAVDDSIISLIDNKVRKEHIYPVKQSACMCLLLNFYMGLRVGELAGLRWCDVDLFNRVLYVRHTEVKFYARDESGQRCKMEYSIADELKTDRGFRDVPLCRKAVEIIKELQKYHCEMGYCEESEFLAYDGYNTSSLTRSLDRTLRRLCQLCGILPFNTHLIRKTFASRLHDGGMPTRIISDIMGHADMATTERCYILGYGEELEKARLMMDDIYKRELPACVSVCS